MVTSGCGPHTVSHGCAFMVWSNNFRDSTWTLCDALTGVVQAPHGNLQCFSYPTGPVRGPCGTCKGAVRHRYRHKGIDTNRICKIPIQHLMWQYGRPLQSLHRLFTGCVWSVSELGLVQTVCQIPRPISLGIWPPVLHTPLCIVTTNPSRTGLNPLMETTIDSDHGLSHVWHQAMVWTNAGLLSVRLLGTNFSRFESAFHHFHSRKYIWKCLKKGGQFVSASVC